MKQDNGMIIACLDDLVQDAPDEPIPEKGSVSSSSTQDKKGSQVETFTAEQSQAEYANFMGWLSKDEEPVLLVLLDPRGEAGKNERKAMLGVEGAAEWQDAEWQRLVVENVQGWGVYAQISQGFSTEPATSKNGTPFIRAKRGKKLVSQPRCLFADFDEPPTPEQASRLDEFLAKFPATATVQSSLAHKRHIYWDIRHEGQGSMDLALWERAIATIILLFGADPACKDASRILRVPGFQNTKPDRVEDRLWCRLLELDEGRVYPWPELVAELERLNGGELVQVARKRSKAGMTNIITGEPGEKTDVALPSKKRGGAPNPESQMAAWISHLTLKFLDVEDNRNNALLGVAINLAGPIATMHSLQDPEDWAATVEGARLIRMGELRSDKPGEAEETVLRGFRQARLMMDEGRYNLTPCKPTDAGVKAFQYCTMTWPNARWNRGEAELENDGEVVDTTRVNEVLMTRYGFTPPDKAVKTWLDARSANVYHPFTEAVEQLEPLPREAFDLEEVAYKMTGSREIWNQVWVRVMLANLVKRQLDPGCQIDFRFDLMGWEGSGKTVLLSSLGGEFYEALKGDENGHILFAKQQRAVVLVDEELHSGRAGKAHEATKARISETHAQHMRKWSNKLMKVPLSCIYFSTSNNTDTYVRGEMNRRLMPLVIEDEYSGAGRPLPYLEGYTIESKNNWVKENRWALLAWIKAWLAEDPSIAQLSKIEFAEQQVRQAAVSNETPTSYQVERFCERFDSPYARKDHPHGVQVRAVTLATALFGSNPRGSTAEVGRALKAMGWEKKTVRGVTRYRQPQAGNEATDLSLAIVETVLRDLGVMA